MSVRLGVGTPVTLSFGLFRYYGTITASSSNRSFALVDGARGYLIGQAKQPVGEASIQRRLILNS